MNSEQTAGAYAAESFSDGARGALRPFTVHCSLFTVDRVDHGTFLP
jgi:hypothetical protein